MISEQSQGRHIMTPKTTVRFSQFLFAILLMSFGLISEAFALTTLKQVQVTNGAQIDLLFDGKISRSQVHTEFVNDTIQISLSDSAVYPAKISSVNGGSITKVFAYQYAPKLVRCRLSVKGKAESFKDQLQISPSGKMLTIRIGGAEAAASPKVKTVPVAARAKAVAKNSVAKNSEVNEPEEKALLEKVLKAGTTGSATGSINEEPVKAAAPVALKAETPAARERAVEKAEANSEAAVHTLGRAEREKPLAGGKSLPNPLYAFGKLAIVLGLFGMLVLGAKKLMHRRGMKAQAGQAGVMGALGRFAQANLGKKTKMIEVLSTHYLGPKKSIVVAKVGNRTLVLGVTNESINLITQLSNGDSVAELIEEDLGEEPGIFSNFLKTENTRPQNQKAGKAPGAGAQAVGRPVPANAVAAATFKAYASNAGTNSDSLAMDPIAAEIAPQPGVRSQIRSRLEGLKQL
jgi:flagellar biogenesis protein FliO